MSYLILSQKQYDFWLAHGISCDVCEDWIFWKNKDQKVYVHPRCLESLEQK